MSNNLNQGASIEADSRAAFKKWHDEVGDQDCAYTWQEAWKEARRTPAAAAELSQATDAGELPPLPDMSKYFDDWAALWTPKTPHPAKLERLLADYARAAIAADRAQQAGAAAPLTGSIAEALAMRDAEIADLRAQLAAKGQGEPVGYLSHAALDRLKAGRTAALLPKALDGKDRIALYAAPASAQPADGFLLRHLQALRRTLENDKHAAAFSSVADYRLHLLSAFDADAQPDQRESAAE